MRLFNTQLVAQVMAKGMEEGQPIEAKSVTKACAPRRRPSNPVTTRFARTC